MVLYIYAGTLFLSAFILFLVQPIIGKMILPKLGGTPQVWNTCMVFFQMVLLAGYAYTHTATTRLNPRRQLMVHALLLLIPLIVLFMFGQPVQRRVVERPARFESNPLDPPGACRHRRPALLRRFHFRSVACSAGSSTPAIPPPRIPTSSMARATWAACWL